MRLPFPGRECGSAGPNIHLRRSERPRVEADYACFDSATVGPIFGTSPTGSAPFNAFAVVENFKTPRAHNYNLSIQREITTNQVLTVGYSGSYGQKLLMYRDLNASPIGGNGVRPYRRRLLRCQRPFYQHIIQATNAGRSRYDSLQATFSQRNWHGLNLTYNYTFSKCFDENSVNRGGAGNYPQANNPFDPSDSHGLCDHDVTHNFNVSGLYSFPTLPMVPKLFGQGWQISTIYTAISGRPFSALISGDPSDKVWPRLPFELLMTEVRSSTTTAIPTLTWWRTTLLIL